MAQKAEMSDSTDEVFIVATINILKQLKEITLKEGKDGVIRLPKYRPPPVRQNL